MKDRSLILEYHLRKCPSGLSGISGMTVITALLLTLTLVLAPTQSLAVDLGQHTQNSSLTEPLDVTIVISDLNGLNEDEVTVSIASARDYELLGIEYVSYLNTIDIEVSISGFNLGSVDITSRIPFNEPYLPLLLELSWPDGYTIKEYSILPEMPVFGERSQSAIGVASSSNQALATANVDGGNTGQRVSPPDAELAIPSSAGVGAVNTNVQQPGGDEYIIQAGDTLSQIAQRVRPSEDISVNQAMLALQRANPEAFPSGNVNNIRPLQVLRVPTEQEMFSLSSSDAVAEIQRQNSVSQSQTQDLEAEPLLMNELQSDSGLLEESDELSVVSSDSTGDDSVAQLESEILLAEETIDRLNVENQELVARVDELSSQIDLLENLIVGKDEQISELNQQVAELADEARLALLEENAAPASASSGTTVDNIMSMLQDNLTYIAIGAGAILLLVLGLMFYRKRSRDDEYYEFDSGHDQLFDRRSGQKSNDAVNPLPVMAQEEQESEAENPVQHEPVVANPEEHESSEPEEVYEVADIEESFDDDIDPVDDDFYSIIQVDEDDLQPPVHSNKGPDDSASPGNSNTDRDELLAALKATEEDMNPNRDLQEAEDERRDEDESDFENMASVVEFELEDMEPVTEEDVQAVSDSAEEITSAIEDFDKPEITDTEDDIEDDFTNFTFDENTVIDDDPEALDDFDDGDDERESSAIDLAVAYEAMGDIDGARALLQNALFGGSEEERIQARKLLDEWQGK